MTTTEHLVEVARARVFIESAGATIRQASGLSFAQVANALHVSPSTVLRWERGERRPEAGHALAYADLLRKLARPS